MGVISRNPQKTHTYIYSLYLVYIPNFNFLTQFGGDIEEGQPFFQRQETETPHISPPKLPGR